MSAILLQYLVFLGPNKPPAELSFSTGLNVICGASETGKSFIVEAIDFMMGKKILNRGIPEKDGYDRVRLVIESPDRYPPLTLERSVEGGDFRSYAELLTNGAPQAEGTVLKWKHQANNQNTLSFALLERVGLTSKVIRKKADGKTRSLSFRDIARLCIVTEKEIQDQGSPFLSGQHVATTAEYAVFKLLLTGIDDSALVGTSEMPSQREKDRGKIELLNTMITDLQTEIDEEGGDEKELRDQLARLDASIRLQNEALATVQKTLNHVLERRGNAAREVRKRRGRISEIEELTDRFRLLDSHYQTDLARLEAIHESGSLFAHLEQHPCPHCGALPGSQHLDLKCGCNIEAIVQTAVVEMVKIDRLRRELADTAASLLAERQDLSESLPQFDEEYKTCEQELKEIASPAVLSERASFNQLVSERVAVQSNLEKIDRLKSLIAQRVELESEQVESGNGSSGTKTQISRNILDEFAQTIEDILKKWHFPNANRVFFDEKQKDFQIAGKGRNSTGKGLRAITHAAVKIGLMEFCRKRNLPHPGFVVLDSPLLGYWGPEGDDDDLRGTDIEDMFYRYLLDLPKNNQVIIIENKHPPEFVFDEGTVTVFTKNPHQGRYGFFPPLSEAAVSGPV